MTWHQEDIGNRSGRRRQADLELSPGEPTGARETEVSRSVSRPAGGTVKRRRFVSSNRLLPSLPVGEWLPAQAWVREALRGWLKDQAYSDPRPDRTNR